MRLRCRRGARLQSPAKRACWCLSWLNCRQLPYLQTVHHTRPRQQAGNHLPTAQAPAAWDSPCRRALSAALRPPPPNASPLSPLDAACNVPTAANSALLMPGPPLLPSSPPPPSPPPPPPV